MTTNDNSETFSGWFKNVQNMSMLEYKKGKERKSHHQEKEKACFSGQVVGFAELNVVGQRSPSCSSELTPESTPAYYSNQTSYKIKKN